MGKRLGTRPIGVSWVSFISQSLTLPISTFREKTADMPREKLRTTTKAEKCGGCGVNPRSASLSEKSVAFSSLAILFTRAPIKITAYSAWFFPSGQAFLPVRYSACEHHYRYDYLPLGPFACRPPALRCLQRCRHLRWEGSTLSNRSLPSTLNLCHRSLSTVSDEIDADQSVTSRILPVRDSPRAKTHRFEVKVEPITWDSLCPCPSRRDTISSPLSEASPYLLLDYK